MNPFDSPVASVSPSAGRIWAQFSLTQTPQLYLRDSKKVVRIRGAKLVLLAAKCQARRKPMNSQSELQVTIDASSSLTDVFDQICNLTD